MNASARNISRVALRGVTEYDLYTHRCAAVKFFGVAAWRMQSNQTLRGTKHRYSQAYYERRRDYLSMLRAEQERRISGAKRVAKFNARYAKFVGIR